MRRVSLIYNPKAGRGSGYEQKVAHVAAALRERGLEVESLPTSAAGFGAAEAADACARGAELVLACGGDGTVHNVLQAMVGQSGAALGVVPMGSANVLARHLRLPMDPVKAALAQLEYVPRPVPVGRVEFASRDGREARYFLSVAGAGPDGMLVYRMLGQGKHLLGRSMYYVRAAWLFATGKFAAFDVTCELENGERLTRRSVSAMAVRVDDLGGLFSPLVRGGAVQAEHMRVSLVKAPALIGLPAWFALSWAGLHRMNRLAETLDVAAFEISGSAGAPVQVQADGEWLGRTPMRVTLVKDAVRLMMPPSGNTEPLH